MASRRRHICSSWFINRNSYRIPW